MKTAWYALLASLCLGQAPPKDVRNTWTPNTDTHFLMPEYKSLAEWEARRGALRKQVLFAAGLLPLPDRSPLNPQVFGRLQRKGYTIEKVLLETLPGYYLGGNLYRPQTPGRHPGVATPHGHWTYGRLEHQPLGSIPARAISLARQGYVVFAYDMVGWNDTVQTPHSFEGDREKLWAFGPLGLQTWNSIRVLDFLQSLPDVDPDLLAVTGASGGGTQTFMLTAVDDRVKASVPVNMVSGIMQGGSPCENQANLRVGTSNVEIAALMAPRPMLLVSATGDWTRNVPREEYPSIRRIYELYGKGGEVEVVQFDAPHNYNKDSREAMYKFFARRILKRSESSGFAERSVSVEKLQDMLALHGRALPANALSYDAIFTQWRGMARRQAEAERSLDAVRERLALAVGAELPDAPVAAEEGGRVVLGRSGKGDRVPASWIDGRGVAAVVVHPEGAEAARKLPLVEKLIGAGRPVLLIDAFQTGSAAAPRDRSHQFFLTFNRSDDAHRVQDILTAASWARRKTGGAPELVGTGKAGIWCLVAAALDPQVSVSGDWSAFKGSDDDFLQGFFVPGIQRAGGLGAILRLTQGRRR